MGGDWRIFRGALRCEFRMQVRRWSVWVTLLVMSLTCFTGLRNPWNYGTQTPLATVIGEWAVVVNAFMPVGLGILLADRLVRDRRLHVDELLDTTAAPQGARLWGKYLGASLATIVPMFLVYLTGIAYVVAKWGDLRAFPLALAAFVTVNLPGLLFVAAFSIVVPVVVWTPLYQFLFIGYWFWGTCFRLSMASRRSATRHSRHLVGGQRQASSIRRGRHSSGRLRRGRG